MNRPNKLYAFAVGDEPNGPAVAVYLTSRPPTWFKDFHEWQADIHNEGVVGSLDPWLFAALFPHAGDMDDKRRLLTFDAHSLKLLKSYYHKTATEQSR